MVNKNDYIGKVLTWDEAVELFPDKWVSFKDCVYNGIDFDKGTLVDVIEDEFIQGYIVEHWEERELHTERTTEGASGGYNCGRIIEEESIKQG